MDGAMENTSDVFSVRLKKLADLRAENFDPYRQNFEQLHTAEDLLKIWNDEGQTAKVFQIAGRIVEIGRAHV